MRLPFGSKKDGNRVLPAPKPSELDSLAARHVPLVRLPDCASCDDLCDAEGQEVYSKLDIDLDQTPLITSMNQYGRMVIASTGKSDWPKEVTEVDGSLALLLEEAYRDSEKQAGYDKMGKSENKDASVFPSSLDERRAGKAPHRKLTILNGSLVSASDHSSVLVFPDYKIVQDVPIDTAGARQVVASALAPDTQPFASTSTAFRSWPLSYRAVILICSHKRRDKRCHVVAPYLIGEFTKALESEGLSVDERGDEHEHGPEPPIEEWSESGTEREKRYDKARRTAAASETVGIFKVSHIGGHRYAGNAIICFPSGVQVWYGRVSPADCCTIVKETIIGGKVIADFLRGGIGIEGKSGPRGVLDW